LGVAGWRDGSYAEAMNVNVVQLGAVAVGETPRVVGIISQLASAADLSPATAPGCDLVEMRLDRMPLQDDAWQAAARGLEERGLPVIATLRIPEEGGEWREGDLARRPILAAALSTCACIDVELQSALFPELVDAAEAQGKALIASYHDYERTPPDDVLLDVEARAAVRPNVIVKIAVRVESEADIERLQIFLARPRQQPLCLIGMGDLGVSTRLTFPARGSCLAYGHLDGSTAPGQLACDELARRIHR
jgi:3-dehydroquinate dehydratase I